MSISTLLLLFIIHYVADFWFQSEKQATTKSFDTRALAIHCLLYALPFLIFGFAFAVITGILHFITDYITSRVAAYFYKKGETRKFFQVVGFDQLVHMFCLVLTYKLLL